MTATADQAPETTSVGEGEDTPSQPVAQKTKKKAKQKTEDPRGRKVVMHGVELYLKD